MVFSDELISYVKSVFREEDSLDLSDADAQDVLSSFAGLFLAFAGVEGGFRLSECRPQHAFTDLMPNHNS